MGITQKDKPGTASALVAGGVRPGSSAGALPTPTWQGLEHGFRRSNTKYDLPTNGSERPR